MILLKKFRNIIIVVSFFTLLYSLISLVNHYNFRTYALDLGAYTNALYDYARFEWNDSGVFKDVNENLLADHFDILLILFSPLSFLLGTYTLLIIQILAVVIGGIGVYVFFKNKSIDDPLPIFATIYFYSFFGVFNAIAFDYHSSVVSSALVPWLFVFVSKRKFFYSSILLFLILFSKENMGLWLSFVLLGLAIEYRKDSGLKKYLILSALISFCMFFVIILLIMPSISIAGRYPHFEFSYLGNDPFTAIQKLLTNPLDSFIVIFSNHNNSPGGDFIKLESHIMILASGLFILFKRIHFVLMLIPIYFQKYFHDEIFMWSAGFHYNIEYAPILSIGIFLVISEIKHKLFQILVSVLLFIMAVTVTLRVMDKSICYTDTSRIRFYQKKHYSRDYDVKKVHDYLSMVPQSAKVSAQSPFLPHLSLRSDIYQFPKIKDAEYIIYSKFEGTYPVSLTEFNQITQQLEQSRDWVVLHNDIITILKRQKGN